MNEATRRNLERKASFIDAVQLVDGVPLFSWVDLNVTELCNRTCAFCPRSGGAYPNQNLNMSVELAERIAHELFFIDYAGSIVFSGFGEPLLHPKFKRIAAAFNKRVANIELVTNGDRLSAELVCELHQGGISFFAVSMYDGPHQVEKFNAIFVEAGVPEANYILRDRWHGAEDDFGLKLTNRAGTVIAGNQPPVDASMPCFYLSYSLVIDWNGDVLLCVQDWHKRRIFGNVHDASLFDIWKSTPAMSGLRRRLAAGHRVDHPCVQCNADGTLHGRSHAVFWRTL